MFWAHIWPIIKRLPVQCGNDDCLLRPRSHVPVFDQPEADWTDENTTLKFILPRSHILVFELPHSHVPVFDQPRADWMGDSTTWKFILSRSHVLVFDQPGADRMGESTTLKFIPPCSHVPVFRPAIKFWLSPDTAVEHRKEQAYSHNTVVWPAGKKPECVNVSISNTCTTVDSATGQWLGVAVDIYGCYPTADRQIPGHPNDRVMWIQYAFLCSATLCGDKLNLPASQKPECMKKALLVDWELHSIQAHWQSTFDETITSTTLYV
jgi:hypothetical protein